MISGAWVGLTDDLTMKHTSFTMTWAILALSCLAAAPVADTGANHTLIQIGFSPGDQAEDSAGGLIVADAEYDQRMDVLGCFRLLCVNGTRCPRTRLPGEGEYRIESLPGYTGDFLRSPTKHFVYAPGHLELSWRNLRDVELVGIPRWLDNRLPIEISHNRITDIGAGGIRIGHFFSWETDGSGQPTERGETDVCVFDRDLHWNSAGQIGRAAGAIAARVPKSWPGAECRELQWS